MYKAELYMYSFCSATDQSVKKTRDKNTVWYLAELPMVTWAEQNCLVSQHAPVWWLMIREW